MSERTDLFTLTITKYEDKSYPWIYWRWMGPGRRSLDIWKISFIFECWWIRG